MKIKRILNKISIFIIAIMFIQLIIPKYVSAYSSVNISGKPLNQAMSDKAGFGIYGIESNGTGIKTGIIPTGMTVAQQQKDGEWRYLGYNYDDNVVSNSAYPGDYGGPEGTKIGGKSYTWGNMQNDANAYSRKTPALNEDSGDIKSANQIGIDYCELIEAASATKPGAFRVWFQVPPYPGYPNGKLMYMTYVIPKDNAVTRNSYVYYREEGTNNSLLPNGQAYIKNTYDIRPGESMDVTLSAKQFEGYKFTRSVTATNVNNWFGNELKGDAGKTRTGTLSFDSTNEFDVIFYYTKDNSNATLSGEIMTDKSSYTVTSDQTNLDIKAKELTSLDIEDLSQVKEIGAKVISYSLNGGADVGINKIKTSSNINSVSTDYETITLGTSNLNEGNNTMTIKGYSWWTDQLGNTKEVSTTKTVSIVKTVVSRPIAIIEAPLTTHTGTTVGVKGSGTDPMGLEIVNYEWTSSNGQTLTGTGGSIKVDAPVTLTLKVQNSKGVWSEPATHIINIENKPPTVKISVAPSVCLGDDLYVGGYGTDPDGDPLEYFWTKPKGMYGDLKDKGGNVYFMDLGVKEFTLTVEDPTGETATATAQTNVVAPYPNVIIETKGTLKENRKLTLDGSISSGGSKRIGLDWTKAKWEVTAVSGGTNTDIKTDSSYIGTKTMDFVFKKAGTYKAKLTLTNTLGFSSFKEITFTIQEDKPPIADFTLTKEILRDTDDKSSNGLYQGTFTVTDLSRSEDSDNIVKRAYFVVFDSDNDGNFDEEICYIYDLNSTLTKQIPGSNSENLHLRPIGRYQDFNTFNIDNINTGNMLEFNFKTTHVGKYLFDVIVKEEFGQPTIEKFTTSGDRKSGTTYEE